MRMTETYLKIAQDCGAQLVDMGNCPIPYGELPEPGAAAQVNFYSQYQLEDCIYKATDALQQQLEAAKQRELELRAVIEKQKALLSRATKSIGAFCGDLGWSMEDMNTMDSIDSFLANNAEPPPKHSANTKRRHLKSYLIRLQFFQTEEGLWLANAIRGMAEERRK